VSFFSELRRRNVFKVGAAYAIVAWLLLQITDVVLPTFNAPQWVAQTITFVLAIGFPVAIVLAWAFDITPQGIKTTSSQVKQDLGTPATALRFGYISQALILLAVGFLLADQFLLRPRTNAVGQDATISTVRAPFGAYGPVRRSRLPIGAVDLVGNTQLLAHLDLSRDGSELVYAAQIDGAAQLCLWPLNELHAQPIAGTNGAYFPFFSFDSDWIGYFTDSTGHGLQRILVRGGASQHVATAVFSGGASAAENDVIVYSTQDDEGGRSLFRVGPNGEPTNLLHSTAEEGFVTPHVLPGARAVLYAARPGSGGSGAARDGHIEVLSLDTGDRVTLAERAFGPRYSPTGHVTFARDGSLWAAPFDLDSLELTGPEIPVVDSVQQNGNLGGVAYTFSDDGTLIYVPGRDSGGGPSSRTRTLVWVDREGNETPIAVPPNDYRHPRLSPDGDHLAVSVSNGGNDDIYVIDLVTGAPRRLTFDPAADVSPIWTPDGNRVVFASDQQGGGIFSKAADGSGSAEPLLASSDAVFPETFAPDGATLVFRSGSNRTLNTLSMRDKSIARPLLQSPSGDHASAISPNGKWIAYDSHERGSGQIVVRPFPETGAKQWQISELGVSEPLWSHAGDELFYDAGGRLMMSRVSTDSEFAYEPPTELLQTAAYVFDSGNERPNYDLHPDDQRFIMIKPADAGGVSASGVVDLVMVENWFGELARLAPPSR